MIRTRDVRQGGGRGINQMQETGSKPKSKQSDKVQAERQNPRDKARSARLASWLISSLSRLLASGKRIKNSYTSPANRRRGGPASSTAPATASPSLVSPAVSPSIFIPQTNHPTNFHASFISFMDSLQRSTSSLTHLLFDFAAISATSAFPLSRSIVAACSSAPPTAARPC
ncbi:hypothetical protein CRENBAI_004294 [Crenichthys baileyi]|uniref:Uncharacterized protein n=1 Tax=Crenichthys baileyi TaxID=28760 RepID=A0AAV9RV57_9TELE